MADYVGKLLQAAAEGRSTGSGPVNQSHGLGSLALSGAAAGPVGGG